MAASFQALQRLSLEWHPYQIAGGRSDISILAKTAKDLAETVKTTLSLANVAMELVKLAATLQQVNPLLMALEALADEVLDQLYNLKEAGFYYLYVDPYTSNRNVTPTPSFVYGFEQLRNQAGTLIWQEKVLNDQGEWLGEWEDVTYDTDARPTSENLANEEVRAKLASPRKIIPGGFNPYEGTGTDPLKALSPYPQFSTMKVLNEFVKAFDDEADVPRYKALTGNPGWIPLEGVTVYDADGASFSGWSRYAEFGIALYDIGLEHQDGSIIKDFRAARKPLNTKIAPGRPSVKGLTNFKTGCGAIAIVIGCPSFDVFITTFNKFSDMFQDIPEFAAKTGKGLLDSLTAIITPEPITVKLTQVDQKYKFFKADDIIGGEKFQSIGKVVSVNTESVVATSMSTLVQQTITNDIGQTRQISVPMDLNPEDIVFPSPETNSLTNRYIDMTMEVTPIRSADGLNHFMSGDRVYEMEQRGKSKDNIPNYVNVGQDTVDLPTTQRIYPKTGIVAMEKLKVLEDSTPPDFGGIQIKDIIPGWGEFFQQLENFVLQLKGMISDSVAFIQDLIDTIKAIEAYLEELIKIITDFLKFFEKQLPATGCYALYIENVQGGTDEIKASINAAKGTLPDLAYAAGVMFVGLEVGGINPIELLATVLGLRQQK